MPLVRIDFAQGKPAGYSKMIGDAVYDAMVKVINVPKDDRFMVITEHPAGEVVFDPTYPGIERSKDCIFIQIFLNQGRTVEMKKAFYQALADDLNARLGLRKEDVFISLVEVAKENWSFGNGIAQYAA
ncbi:MAG TPA: tautomerase family protein [Xanthobacteraceae bacterium]|nr:tautomerase family protein [Xanthobacteraceae bacterium]